MSRQAGGGCIAAQGTGLCTLQYAFDARQSKQRGTDALFLIHPRKSRLDLPTKPWKLQNATRMQAAAAENMSAGF